MLGLFVHFSRQTSCASVPKWSVEFTARDTLYDGIRKIARNVEISRLVVLGLFFSFLAIYQDSTSSRLVNWLEIKVASGPESNVNSV